MSNNRSSQSDLNPNREQTRNGSNRTALVVDDNATNQLVLRKRLEHYGFKPDVASNGLEAVEKFESSGPYSIIFMDCQMPLMSGYEAARKIRQLEAEASTKHRQPIIALTANAQEEDKSLCIEAGMDDYVQKPVSKDALEQLLHFFRSRSK